MSDSDDFVMYDPKDISSLVSKDIRKTLMVCHTNQSRKEANKVYLDTL
ncbi:MAG: hypothetical protein J6S85_05500 [Methanobrevibacter sp.]|nr:hypothetical protein [Methanobrevibacter sp.]